jgi:hypothetical protein
MKTTILTISVIFLLNIGHVTAGNDVESPVTGLSITESLLKNLAPVTPKEAGFDEEFTGMDNSLLTRSLAPVTPRNASFEDSVTTEISIKQILQLLAPKNPKEVDFNDPMENISNFGQSSPLINQKTSYEELK